MCSFHVSLSLLSQANAHFYGQLQRCIYKKISLGANLKSPPEKKNKETSGQVAESCTSRRQEAINCLCSAQQLNGHDRTVFSWDSLNPVIKFFFFCISQITLVPHGSPIEIYWIPAVGSGQQLTSKFIAWALSVNVTGASA